MARFFHVLFDNGLKAPTVYGTSLEDLPETLSALGFLKPQPTLTLVGGASKMSDADVQRLQQLFTAGLAPLAESLGAVVVDGGTDSGIMRLIGCARAEIGGTFPLVGVSPQGKVKLPDAEGEGTPLEPHHTHFVLVPGDRWGDESPWIARIAGHLAGEYPAMTLVINGGEVTWQDVSASVGEGRVTVTLAGSGRTADVLATALQGQSSDERSQPIIATGLLETVELTGAPADVAERLRQILSSCPLVKTRGSTLEANA